MNFLMLNKYIPHCVINYRKASAYIPQHTKKNKKDKVLMVMYAVADNKIKRYWSDQTVCSIEIAPAAIHTLKDIKIVKTGNWQPPH